MKQLLKSKSNLKIELILNNNSIFYNANKCYSYNLFFNTILGGRGIGKTTTFLIKGIQNYNKDNSQFVYVRRYKPELKQFIKKDTLGGIAKGITYKGDGSGGYEFNFMNDTIGYGITLAQQSVYKSSNFPRVTTIIFDEFTLKKGNYHYLPDEVSTFFELVSTIFRTRTNGKVILLGNNIDLFNPYFAYYNIPTFNKIYTDTKRGIYCELAENSPELLKREQDTGLYKLTNDTLYGQYHYENKVLSDSNYLIIDKPKQVSLLARFVFNNETINVYNFYDKKQFKLYCERRDKIINDNKTYVILEHNNPNYYYIKLYQSSIKNYIQKQYFNNLIYYDDEKCGSLLNYLINNA